MKATAATLPRIFTVATAMLIGWLVTPITAWAWPQEVPAEGAAQVQDETAPPAEQANDQQDEATDESDQVDLNENTMEKFVSGLRSLRKYSRLAPEIVDVFTAHVGSASASTVRLYGNGRQVAVGMIVDSSGLILTKASELRLPLECQLPDGTRVPAAIHGVDPATDLAMLHVDVSYPLPSADLKPSPAPAVGRWLASVAVDPRPISIGVVSVFQRQISSSQARLGIFPADHEKGVRINNVTPDSPADRADLLINDVITKINEDATPDSAVLRKVLAKYEPGDTIVITLLRQDQEMTFRVVLASAEELGGAPENPQERMGSTLSRRRQSYPLAFQHDSGLQANQCGSPLVDLDGQIVGVNISRSGRVATYALPMEVVLPAVERLRTGELAPAVVFREELANLDVQIQERTAQMEALPEELDQAEKELPRDEAKREELQRTIAELEKRVAELTELENQRRLSIDEMKDTLKRAEADLKRLQEKRDLLMFGIR